MTFVKTFGQRGLRASDYAIIGDVLFWSLQFVLGDKVLTEEVNRGWIRVYSSFLRRMLPLAIGFERDKFEEKSSMKRLFEGGISGRFSSKKVSPSII